jgi:hypothetical protein
LLYAYPLVTSPSVRSSAGRYAGGRASGGASNAVASSSVTSRVVGPAPKATRNCSVPAGTAGVVASSRAQVAAGPYGAPVNHSRHPRAALYAYAIARTAESAWYQVPIV